MNLHYFVFNLVVHLYGLPQNDCALFEDFLNLVVVDAELRKEDLILVLAQGALQCLVSLLVCHTTLLYQSPESRIVQIVDVTIDLTPRQIVFHHLQIGVEDNPGIKRRNHIKRSNSFKILRQVETVG